MEKAQNDFLDYQRKIYFDTNNKVFYTTKLKLVGEYIVCWDSKPDIKIFLDNEYPIIKLKYNEKQKNKI